MGSEKYPDENEYDSFLAKHGGSSNAFTEMVTLPLPPPPVKFNDKIHLLLNYVQHGERTHDSSC